MTRPELIISFLVSAARCERWAMKCWRQRRRDAFLRQAERYRRLAREEAEALLKGRAELRRLLG